MKEPHDVVHPGEQRKPLVDVLANVDFAQLPWRDTSVERVSPLTDKLTRYESREAEVQIMLGEQPYVLRVTETHNPPNIRDQVYKLYRGTEVVLEADYSIKEMPDGIHVNTLVRKQRNTEVSGRAFIEKLFSYGQVVANERQQSVNHFVHRAPSGMPYIGSNERLSQTEWLAVYQPIFERLQYEPANGVDNWYKIYQPESAA